MSLTIIAYHYVRPMPDPRFPSLRGRDITAFRRQLRHLRDNYHILSGHDLMEALREGTDVDGFASRSALLTFDDGYADHYRYVAPVLSELGISGCFFPIGRSVREHKLSDANKIQLLLKEAPETLWQEASSLWETYRGRGTFDTEPPAKLQHAITRRFDSPAVAAIKNLLQQGGPLSIRRQVIDSLFRDKVTSDESALAQELYMNETQLRELSGSGMYIGSHGYSHEPLGPMTTEEAEQDIGASLSFLQELGVDTKRWMMCYPSGSHSQTLIEVLRRLGAVAAFTVVPGEVHSLANPFTLPRWDTNDISVD